jgi:hypothetical protein
LLFYSLGAVAALLWQRLAMSSARGGTGLASVMDGNRRPPWRRRRPLVARSDTQRRAGVGAGKLIADPERITSIGMRDWAHIGQPL